MPTSSPYSLLPPPLPQRPHHPHNHHHSYYHHPLTITTPPTTALSLSPFPLLQPPPSHSHLSPSSSLPAPQVGLQPVARPDEAHADPGPVLQGRSSRWASLRAGEGQDRPQDLHAAERRRARPRQVSDARYDR